MKKVRDGTERRKHTADVCIHATDRVCRCQDPIHEHDINRDGAYTDVIGSDPTSTFAKHALTPSYQFSPHSVRSLWIMGGASGVAGGSCSLCPMLCPRLPPVVVRKKYTCPFDPSRPLSQRKVYVKIHQMCQNTAQSMLNFFLLPVSCFPQLKVR